MAFAIQDAQSAASSFASNVTVALNAGSASGRAIFALASLSSSPSTTIDSATYNGVAMTMGTAFTDPATNRPLRPMWLTGDGNIATGSHNLVATFNDGNGKPSIIAMAWSGGNAISGEANASASSLNPTLTLTTSNGSLMLLLTNQDNGAGAATPDSGTTIQLATRPDSNNVDLFACSEPATGSSQAIGYTVGSPTPSWSAVGVSLSAAAAGGTLAKVNEVAVASISALDGVAYASIKSANGLTTGN